MEFRYAVELDNQYASAHLGLAALNYNKENYAASEHHVDEAIKCKNHWADAYLLKGKILYQKEEYQQALSLLNQAEEVSTNGNGNNRKTLKSDIFLWRGLCLKNLNSNELAGIELSAALELNPDNQTAIQALEEIRLISKMTVSYPQSVKNIINKKAISRAEWAALLVVGLTKKYFSTVSSNLTEDNINLPDVSANRLHSESIRKAVQWNLVNVYPDDDFKPDLNLSWGEVIISIRSLLKGIDTNQNKLQIVKPPFSDLPDLHPLFDSATMATSVGTFKNLSQRSYQLSEGVSGMDALYLIRNLNQISDKLL